MKDHNEKIRREKTTNFNRCNQTMKGADMKNILIGLCISVFFGGSFVSAAAVDTEGDNPRIDRRASITIPAARDPVAMERISSKVDFLTGTAELSDADYAKLFDYLSAIPADGEHRKITIAVWPDTMGDQAIDEIQQDLINSRISEITAILADQGYFGDIETRNMATTTVDPIVDPELKNPSLSSAIILIESITPQTSLSH
jgi:hypothetical protein